MNYNKNSTHSGNCVYKVEIQLHVYYYQVIITSRKFVLALGAYAILFISEKFSWA